MSEIIQLRAIRGEYSSMAGMKTGGADPLSVNSGIDGTLEISLLPAAMRNIWPFPGGGGKSDVC